MGSWSKTTDGQSEILDWEEHRSNKEEHRYYRPRLDGPVCPCGCGYTEEDRSADIWEGLLRAVRRVLAS